MGGGTRFLQAGSSLALECVVTHTHGPPPAVFWYRDSEVVDYDSPRGGISLEVGRNSGRGGEAFTGCVAVAGSGDITDGFPVVDVDLVH